jgi:SAM-dependent methyltransferase
MTDTDYAKLWHDLVERSRATPGPSEERLLARWRRRARGDGYSEERRKRDRDDPLMGFVLGRLEDHDTVLDVGAGIGRWSIPMAMRCRSVTALDKLEGVLEILRENAEQEKLENIETIQGDWLEVSLQPHDHVLSSHAAYGCPDIVAYARRMDSLARRACYLVMRVPRHDGVLGELSRRIHGGWHDSPNFPVGYNALLQAGICGDVIMEQTGRRWHDATLEDALARAKRHLYLGSAERDEEIVEVLRERLSLREEGYWWPDWMRSALVWWRPSSRSIPVP